MDRRALTDRLRRLARAAPGAFRADPVFRYAAIGALAALLILTQRLGHPAPGGLTPPPLPPVAHGLAYDDPSAAPPPAAPATGPIAPGHALASMVVQPDGRQEPDRFGVVGPAQTPPKRPSE